MNIDKLNPGDAVLIDGWGGTFEVMVVDHAGGEVLVAAPDFMGEWVPAARVVGVLNRCGSCQQPIRPWETCRHVSRNRMDHIDCPDGAQ